MTTIYMIRHAEAEGNLYRIVQGQHNSFITPRGHRQIACLAERFKDVQLDALYSSDLRRTVTTAGAITKYHALEMQLTERLREINLGVCEGMSFGDMYKFDPVQMDNFNNDPAQWRAPGAETFAQCTERIVSVVTEIAVKNDGKTVAVVSHGMAIRSLLAHILGVASRDIPSLPHGDNTAVSKLIFDNGAFDLRPAELVEEGDPRRRPQQSVLRAARPEPRGRNVQGVLRSLLESRARRPQGLLSRNLPCFGAQAFCRG